MTATQYAPPQDLVLDFLVEKATPEAILAFKLPEKTQQRVSELLDKQDEDTLTQDERAELEQVRQTDLLMMALRARALLALHDKNK